MLKTKNKIKPIKTKLKKRFYISIHAHVELKLRPTTTFFMNVMNWNHLAFLLKSTILF